MKIPIGIFFGGATPFRDHSLQNAKRIIRQLDRYNFELLPLLVDPFGQLILLENGIPDTNTISDFYPDPKFFNHQKSFPFPVYPEQLGDPDTATQAAMAEELGALISLEELPQHISLAFLTFPDQGALQKDLSGLRIPFTGELREVFDLWTDRFGMRMQLEQEGVQLPHALRLTAREWQENSLQAIWGEDSASVAYPLLLQPSHQYSSGRSTVVTSKDGPEGLRRAIDLAFGQRRLSAEDWLDMSPVDRENFVRHLAQWSSGIGFPLELQAGSETMVFQDPQALLHHLHKLSAADNQENLILKARKKSEDIMVSSLPEGHALSCLLFAGEDKNWEVADFRFLGDAGSIVAGTDAFPATKGAGPRVADSLKNQVIAAATGIARELHAECGLRVFGILSPEGRLIPEEIQPFLGPEKGENITSDHLKSFIIASLRARQAKMPDPAYRTLVETLTALPLMRETTGKTPAIVLEDAPLPEMVAEKVVEPEVTEQEETVDPRLYERELEKLNKEKEAMPERLTILKENPNGNPKSGIFHRIWESIKQFFRSREFLRNAGAMAVFFLLCYILLTMMLRAYTKHGDSMQLEDYQGLLLEDAERKAASKGLKMEVISTSFQPGKRPNEVFAQYPEPLSKVKENRTVFVSIYQNEGKEIVLPAFTDVGDDIETYRRELVKRKIKVAITEQVFKGKLAEGTILFLIIDGKQITNTQLRKGDVKVAQGGTVEAVISTRVSKYVEIPNLVCQPFNEASFELTARYLVVGKVYGGDSGNRNNYYVWKQDPEYAPDKLIDKGEQVDLYLTPTKPDGCGGADDDLTGGLNQ